MKSGKSGGKGERDTKRERKRERDWRTEAFHLEHGGRDEGKDGS